MTLVNGIGDKLEAWKLQENLTILLHKPLKPDTSTIHDLSETSSAYPSKMGEGGNGPSNCPLPKVVRSGEDSLKSDMNQEKTMNCEQPMILATGLVDEYSIKTNPVNWSALGETICTLVASYVNSMNANEDYDLSIVTLPVPKISSLRPTYILIKSLYFTPIGNIIPDGCDLLTVRLIPDSVYPNATAIEPTTISNPMNATSLPYILNAEDLIDFLSCP